jgi:cytoskeleton protein RodZ
VQVPPAPVKPAVQPSSQPVPPPAPPKPSAPAVQAPAPSALANVRMQFDQPAWVQVRDSTGRTLHAGLNPAGGSVEVSGKPPFFLVVGNAANVRVTYKGKLVDLKPYIDVTVARLTLNP